MNGNPIPLHKQRQESLRDAGIKVSNHLSEIDPSPRPDKGQNFVSRAAKGSFPVEGLYNNLLFGTPMRGRRARRQASRTLADQLKRHQLDNEMIVSSRDGLFKDRSSALEKSPNSGLFGHLLFGTSTKQDLDPKAAALHDNGMIVDNHVRVWHIMSVIDLTVLLYQKGFFSDSESSSHGP